MDETTSTVATPAKGEPTSPAGGTPTNSSVAAKTPSSDVATAPSPKIKRRRWARLWQIWRTSAGVWLGLFIAAAGFGLIAYTWSKVAALVNVALQMPYLMSGGLPGIGLIMLGLLVVNLALKRREALDRHRQLEEVREALVRLRQAIEDDPEPESE